MIHMILHRHPLVIASAQAAKVCKPLLAKPQPAGNSTLGLGRLLSDRLVEIIRRLLQFLTRVLVSVFQLLRALILQLIDLRAGLMHFRCDYAICLPDFATYVANLGQSQSYRHDVMSILRGNAQCDPMLRQLLSPTLRPFSELPCLTGPCPVVWHLPRSYHLYNPVSPMMSVGLLQD